MAIFSAQQIFSEDQLILGSAPSDNILDLGEPGVPYGAFKGKARDIGKGNPVCIGVQVTQDFDALTSLNIAIEVDSDELFGSPKVVISKDVLLADLVAGYQFPLEHVPNGVDERYMRLNYTVTGTDPTVGAIQAGITLGNQTNIIE
jgi:hypothetical protein